MFFDCIFVCNPQLRFDCDFIQHIFHLGWASSKWIFNKTIFYHSHNFCVWIFRFSILFFSQSTCKCSSNQFIQLLWNFLIVMLISILWYTMHGLGSSSPAFKTLRLDQKQTNFEVWTIWNDDKPYRKFKEAIGWKRVLHKNTMKICVDLLRRCREISMISK